VRLATIPTVLFVALGLAPGNFALAQQQGCRFLLDNCGTQTNPDLAEFLNGVPFVAVLSTESSRAGYGALKFRMIFSPNGTMTREPISGGHSGQGTWRMLGNDICMAWKGASEYCYSFQKVAESRVEILRDSTTQAVWMR
jgi:hypothetical protein